MSGTLHARVDALVEMTIDVLEAAKTEGWSPETTTSALDVVDVLGAALGQRGGAMREVMRSVRFLARAARGSLHEPLPQRPPKGSLDALEEKHNGVVEYRAWRNARHQNAAATPSSG
ncbi:hypothetical protein ABZV65_30830 [Streptomyces bauhiniae]|uniref:hypothetical protein n=1 Tax=Streptomyces bauhiniae TaxID=2340725 RepID=UPI0033B7DC47